MLAQCSSITMPDKDLHCWQLMKQAACSSASIFIDILCAMLKLL
jgi:hypothetical protein